MKRQDQRAGFAHPQTRANFNTHRFKLGDLLEQMAGGQHHTVADVTLHARPHDAAGNEVQSGLHAIDHQSVASVVTALKTHHALGHLRQPIDQLAFALVAPLGANHHYIAASRRARFICHRQVSR